MRHVKKTLCWMLLSTPWVDAGEGKARKMSRSPQSFLGDGRVVGRGATPLDLVVQSLSEPSGHAHKL